MNKLLIGLLIVAAGAGIFFLLRKKKDKQVASSFNKEWIIGQWKANTVDASDSNGTRYKFDFQKEGTIVRSLGDSTKKDTSHYEWTKTNDLVFKQKTTDSSGKVFAVNKLTKDSLELRSTDSMLVVFTKIN